MGERDGGGRGDEMTSSPGHEEAERGGEEEEGERTGGGQRGEVGDEAGVIEEEATDGARIEVRGRERESGARPDGATEAAEDGAGAEEARGRARRDRQRTSSRTFGEMWRATD